MDRKVRQSLGATVRHHSASLVMQVSDPHERFFYPLHTPMKDTYSLALELRQLKQDVRSDVRVRNFRSDVTYALPRKTSNVVMQRKTSLIKEMTNDI